MKLTRRKVVTQFGGVSGALFLMNKALASDTPENDEQEKNKEVTAVEDLMREHGVLRRALFVYSETARRLQNDPSQVLPDALHKTAKLFRNFGEDYHEKKLEEAYIFPVVKQSAGPVSDYPHILIAQHNRGREITDFLLDKTKGMKIEADAAGPLVIALESFVRMYRPHAAREDTVVFPAWKQILPAEQLDEMNEKFEDIEHEMFGEGGFEKAVQQIMDIEKELGLADLAQFTAPAPPSL
jgi:hemerythrin-like domain-containing protein